MKKYIWGAVIIVVVLVIGIFVMSSKSVQTKGFNIGLISILSGDYAAVGENVRNGVVLADEIYNKNHPDAPINLTIEDDGFTGGKGINAYQKLLGVNHVDALINVSTPTIDSIYDLVTKTSLPVLQVGDQGREPVADNVFGVFPSSVMSEYDYGVYMRNRGVKEMSLVYTNHDAMIRFVESFKNGFQGKVNEFKIDAAEKDYRTHALKVAATNPDAVGLFIFPQQGAQFIKEYLKVVKVKPQLFFDTNFQSGYTDYQRILGDLTVLDGALVGSLDSTVSDEFKTAYKARFGTDAGFLADIGYDAFNTLAATHSEDGKIWQKNIANVSYDGVGGKIEFDAAGNRKPKTKMMIISGGKIVDIK